MAKRKNRAATEQELGLITNIQPDARMNDHHDQHSNANKAIVDLYHALDIDVDGATGDIILGADFGNTVPDPSSADAGKVLATDGTDYGWAYVDSDHILLTANMNPFGILDDPAAGDPNLTQAGANALFVKYINENEESVKELAAALGLDLNVDVDGNITIELPGGGEVPSLDDKFDANDAAGDGPSTLTNAKDMEDAIDANKADIDNLVVELGGTVNPDGSIDIDNIDALPDGGNEGEFLSLDDQGDAVWVDADVFPKGGSGYDSAQDVEDAIAAITGLEVLAFKGNVSDASSLPNGADEGDVYLVEDVSEFHVMTSDGWKFLGKLGISAAELAQLQSDIADKYNAGAGPLDYADATVLGQAVKANESSISENTTNLNNLLAELNLEIDANGEIIIIGGGEVPDLSDLEKDIAGKFDIGTGTQTLNDATAMEAAIGENATNIENVITGLGGTVNPDGSIDIAVDGLPDQSGQGGKFLTTDGSDASWGDVTVASDDTKFDKGAATYADAGAMEADIKDNASDIAANEADIATNATEIAKKFDHGGTSYSDAKAMEDAIKTNTDAITNINNNGAYDDTELRGLIGDKFTDGGATTYTTAKEMEDAITTINNSGYDDTELRGLISDEETARVEGDKDLQDQIDVINTQGYNDTEVRGLISDNASDISDNATAIAGKLDKGTSTYADAQAIQDAIEGIVVPNVDDFVTETELNTALSGKSDTTHDHSGVYAEENHTHDDLAADDHTHDIADVPHNHDGDYQAKGDYATNDALTNGLAGKSDTTHTHDTTHDHDGVYAKDSDLSTLEGRVATNEGDISSIKTEQTTQNTNIQANADAIALLENYDDTDLAARVKANEDDIDDIQAEQIVQNGKIDANATKNTEQDGKISALETANKSLENKLDAIENAIINAQYNISIAPNPREGYVSIGDDTPSNVTLLTFNAKDANGATHNFDQIKEEDVVTISTTAGVGSYTISSDPSGGFFSVTFISGNGTLADDSLADVVVSPAFDASSYATITYVDAQDELMYPKGDVPNGEARTYEDAYSLEKAVLTHAEAINANADAIDAKVSIGAEQASKMSCTAIVALTKDEYEALTPEPTVMYLVVG